MNFKKEVVIENINISPGIYKLTVSGNYKVVPGQFFLLRAWDREPVLSRPISVNETFEDTINFVYQVLGRGTDLFKALRPGEELMLTGPLGNGFPVPKEGKRVALVSGGIGIAPLLELSKKLGHCSVDLYCGFKESSYLVEEFSSYVDKTVVATESGQEGHKGFVTDYFDPSLYEEVFCCGPEAMMKKVIKICEEANTPLWVSSEKHMACGIGACLVCTCRTKDGNKRACKDGPVFSGSMLAE